MKTSEALAWAENYLQEHQIEDSRLEAEILLAHSLSISRTKLLTLDAETPPLFQELIIRRAKHEPTAYITGTQPFFGLDFFVDRSVLIPRPETELLVENIITLFSHSSLVISHFTVADIGTGSGCIAVSLAKQLPNISVIGIDSSPAALKLAQRNAEHHGVSDRCKFILGDLFEPLKEQVDLIVSNPPYIPSAVIETLEPEVKDWEPREALDGGKDGLDYIKKIIKIAPNHLTTNQPNNPLLIEIGFDQGKKVRQLVAETNRYQAIEVIKDLGGKDRILKAYLSR
ncbi:MAG: peptide chain release factor N(5)-glutamine methyltransferase [Candidatus Margulisbacteria bacterium]|nr:peptide chain release factor N(5)-glutamine methyltransferase [Candidatus Margulisiibacteriota bacterium]